MTLRNAFEDVATDRLLRRVAHLMNFARDANDRIRAVVDSGAVDVTAIRWGSNNSNPSWYSTGAGNAMDTREMQRQYCRQSFLMARNHRWEIT